MNSYEISEKFYALFFNGQKDFRIRDYLDNSFCDDILDVDLKKNVIKSLCHVENKYAVVTSDGSYVDTYNFVTRNIVYPEDRKIYEELMDPSHLKERQEKSKTPNFRFAQFRNKLANGRYKWVEQVVLSGKENGVPKDHYIVYVFDIENMKNKEYGLSVTKDSSAFPKDIDENTGLLKEQSFFKLVDEALEAKTIKKPCIVNLDIEHFKFFDEWNGREVGDRLLKQIAAVLKKIADKHEGIVGYMGQDDFVLLLPFDMNCFNRIYDSIKNVILSFGFSFGFNPAIGVALIEEDVPSFVYDKASIACSMSKKNAKERITVYEAEFHSQTEREFKVILEFINALKNNEITFYLQPQCRISTKKVVGLEALTRWIKKDGTIISPGEFIPVLEKYGFITDLDKYIWEKVCHWISKWAKKGHTPVPVSINVSQVDIYNLNIVEYLSDLVKKYDIEPRLLKIEITESSLAEDFDKVISIVEELRKKGFMVLMDDFGSGYSSLNMLMNIKFDVIKLDSGFLKSHQEINEFRKSVNVLETVVNMAKTIAIPIIIEGVETEEQVKFLEQLGCRYVQGYYFYRPLPIKEIERIIADPENVDERGYVVKLNEQFRLREFLDENIYSDSMLNNVIGAVAIYALHDKGVDIVRFNQQFYESVNTPGFHDRLRNIEQFVPKVERQYLFKLLNDAKENKIQGSQGVVRFYKEDGTLTTYIMRFYYLNEQDGSSRFYGSANNVTQYSNLQQQMLLIAKYSSDSLFFIKLVKDNEIGMKFTVAVFGLDNEIGMNKNQFEEELNDGRFYRRVDQNKLSTIKELIFKAIRNRKKYAFTFNMRRDDGTIIPLTINGNPIEDPLTGYAYIVNMRLAHQKELDE